MSVSTSNFVFTPSSDAGTDSQRLAAIAARVRRTYEPSRQAQALLDKLLAADMPAFVELMRPVMLSRADEFLRSARGELPAVQDGLHGSAEKAKADVPSCEISDGHGGRLGRAEQANTSLPRPSENLVPVTSHLRSKPYTKQSNPITSTLPANYTPDLSALRNARQVAAKGVLDVFMIGETPLRDATPAMCRTFAKKRTRDARFIERIIAGVPENSRIGNYVKPDEATAIYEAVNKEIFNV